MAYFSMHANRMREWWRQSKSNLHAEHSVHSRKVSSRWFGGGLFLVSWPPHSAWLPLHVSWHSLYLKFQLLQSSRIPILGESWIHLATPYSMVKLPMWEWGAPCQGGGHLPTHGYLKLEFDSNHCSEFMKSRDFAIAWLSLIADLIQSVSLSVFCIKGWHCLLHFSWIFWA